VPVFELLIPHPERVIQVLAVGATIDASCPRDVDVAAVARRLRAASPQPISRGARP
jgi:hypothetical protein